MAKKKLDPIYLKQEVAFCPICGERMKVGKTVRDENGEKIQTLYCKNKTCRKKVYSATTIVQSLSSFRRH